MSSRSITEKKQHNKGSPVILITVFAGYGCYKIGGRVE